MKLHIRPYHGFNGTLEQKMWDAFKARYDTDIGAWLLEISMDEFVKIWCIQCGQKFLAYPSDEPAEYDLVIFITTYSSFQAR